MSIAVGCGVFLLIFAGAIVSIFLRAWALTVLWGWFIVPTFHIAPITMTVAMGASVIIGLFRVAEYKALEETTDPLEKRKRYTHVASQWLLVPLMSVAMGWLIHIFM